MPTKWPGPTGQPSQQPSSQPSQQPTHSPSIYNSNPKAGIPSGQPSSGPSQQPTVQVSLLYWDVFSLHYVLIIIDIIMDVFVFLAFVLSSAHKPANYSTFKWS